MPPGSPVAGCAGYMVAIFGMSVEVNLSLGWPWWIGVPLAIVIAVIFGTLSGALAVVSRPGEGTTVTLEVPR